MRAAILALLLLAGCDALNPRPGPIRAMAPIPNPPAVTPEQPATVGARARRNPWLTQFWAELSRARQRQVAARLRRAPYNKSAEEAPAAWDVMGLAEREALIFGRRAGH
ncbi:hypothetical protein JYK14_14855 [Siccirubricoccus sp. KC 17139]|uniref:DUF3106 domain-containing protein n=1 Tax=Siccirubricoccus soli TaxID=2899147 RepID=A0ABT1D692_9PROT|nr:hypothetical protein [Siccirubricoccus soli]MCO6417431.1 hypothetical protein [Siccirubricoccus soli]MCP2683566.1 hypothetical protein [Siccirubricoccus soli]